MSGTHACLFLFAFVLVFCFCFALLVQLNVATNASFLLPGSTICWVTRMHLSFSRIFNSLTKRKHSCKLRIFGL